MFKVKWTLFSAFRCMYLQASVTARASLGESECKERVSRILNASQEEAGDAEVLCLEVGRRLKLLCPITFVKSVNILSF